MDEIYKIGYLKGNKIEKMYIFNGLNDNNLNDLFKKDPTNDIFNKILNEKEFRMIENEGMEIEFINDRIYIDDTIETIKKKYILANKNEGVTYSGIYFFNKTIQNLETVKIYEQLSQNGNIEISSSRLIEYLLNIDDLNISDLPIKDIYDYDDILNLMKKLIYSEPFQNCSYRKDYLYCKPFNVLEYDDFLTQYAT